MKKDIVIGLGEIGMPIYKILSKAYPVEGLDKNKKLLNQKKNDSLKFHDIDFIHFCIPYNKMFEKTICAYDKNFSPNLLDQARSHDHFTSAYFLKDLSPGL